MIITGNVLMIFKYLTWKGSCMCMGLCDFISGKQHYACFFGVLCMRACMHIPLTVATYCNKTKPKTCLTIQKGSILYVFRINYIYMKLFVHDMICF